MTEAASLLEKYRGAESAEQSVTSERQQRILSLLGEVKPEWEKYEAARGHLPQIKLLELGVPALKTKAIIQGTPSLLGACMECLTVQDDVPVSWLLTLFYEMLREDSSCFGLFEDSLKDQLAFHRPLLQLLGRQGLDKYVADKAAWLLTAVTRTPIGKPSPLEVHPRHASTTTTTMTAQAPSAAMEEPKALSAAQCLKKLLLCLVYISVSTILIRFNVMMMHKDRFPFAMALSAIHMFVSTMLCALLYAVAPSMFPAMEKTMGHRHELMRMFVPIGAFFAVMLYGSNQAYAYCSVALLQFMKEANVMIVFLISCAVGLQSVNRMRMALIAWVIAGAAISVSGDLKFSLVGVAFQAASQLAECARVVLGEILLNGKKLDPLTYTSFVAPLCFVVLVVATLCNWDSLIIPAFVNSWPLLLLNACVAFILNVLVATVIKEISAVGFVLTGLTKDIVIVVLSSILFGEHITLTQWSAFAMTLGGVGLWSLMKISPDSVPIQMLERALCMPRREAKAVEDGGEAGENSPLVAKKV